MAQISYGTITITDTTDIERIYPVYCKGGETTAPALQPLSNWSEIVSQAGGTGDYIWQRIVTKKQDVTVTINDYSDAVRLTGDSGSSLTITSIQYAQTQGENDTPSYSSSMPSPINEGWWLWVETTYSDGSPVVTKIKQGQKGETGQRGTSILKITTAPTAYTTTQGGFTPAYRISLSTVKTQSGKNEVLIGDIIEYNSNHYGVGYVDSSYVYLSVATSIKGADGQTYYTHIRYATDSSGSNMSSSPSGKTYIGVYSGISQSAPTTASSYSWSKYVGDSAVQYYAFVKYATNSSGANMRDTPASGYDYVGTYTGTKASPTASDFNWSKYTGEPGTPATQYYAFIRYATSSTGANMTDTPTSSTTYVGTYSGTKTSPTASDYKWSIYVGSNGISVSSIRELYYLKTNSTNPSQITWNSSTSQPSTTIYSNDRTNAWTSIVPSYTTGGTYYTCIETSLSNSTKTWSAPVINNALTNANAKALEAYNSSIARDTEVDALQAQAKHFWWDSEGAHIAAGQNTTSVDNIDWEQPSTYTFNALTAPGFLKLRYQNIDFVQLATNSLTFYRPAVNGSTYVQGKKAMDLTADALTFYKPLAYNSSNDPTAAATLNSNGLILYRPGTNNKKSVELDSTALKFYDANENMIASYGNKIVLGKKTSSASSFSRAEFEFNSMKLYAKGDSNPYFWVEDKRNENGVATIVESFSVNTEDTEFNIIQLNYALKTFVTVYVDNNDITQVSAYGLYQDSRYKVQFDPSLFSEGTTHTISVEYTTEDAVTSMTFGSRDSSIYGPYSFSEGEFNIASGTCSHAEGRSNKALGQWSHAEGLGTTASGNVSHAEGLSSIASGGTSHTEGYGTTASGGSSHAEGSETTASGSYSHAEGLFSNAFGASSHAEGSETTTTGFYSHAEGFGTTTSGTYSHAEGYKTIASGNSSHAQNKFTVATEDSQTVIGRWNRATVSGDGTSSNPWRYSNVGNYAFIIGNGTENTIEDRSNALTVDWDGNLNLPTGNFSGVGTTLTYNSSKSNTNSIAIINGSSNVFTVDWNGNAYCYPETISLGAYVASGILTNNGGELMFSIPLGRVLPSNASISKITFLIVARVANANGTGYYCIKGSSGGTGTVAFDSSTTKTFYDAGNNSRSLTAAMWNKSIRGGANLYVDWNSGTSYFFSGTSTINGYVNNNPVVIYLNNIEVTLAYS